MIRILNHNKKVIICILLAGFFLLPLKTTSQQSEPLNLLSGRFTPEKLAQIIQTADKWHPYPTAEDHASWQELPSAVRDVYILEAEKLLNNEWQTPTASVFLEYSRDGNRSNYEKISFGRREQLGKLVIAECMEGRGRFINDIVNGIWTICEETYWGVPAHMGMQKRGTGLPDVTEPTVDLFAAETGMLMAWTYYLLKDQLYEVSSLVNERIRYEVKRRIIDVNLKRDDFGWMGLSPDLTRRVNNWNPWICSNWLTAVLILEENPEIRAQSIYKIMRCLDQFLNPYPTDGGCDEGPGYWNRAGASLFDCLELFDSASNGRINIYNEPLVQEIGRYIYRVYINKDYYINFADASAKLQPDPSLLFRFGKSIGDKNMLGFASFEAKRQNFGTGYIGGSFGYLGRVLAALFSLSDLVNIKAEEPMVFDYFFPDLQVMLARSIEGSNKGLYIAAKGGHNDESHNHNDVGNFIVYADGFPAIIDVGVETYTSKTFSSRRYEIWTMQSAYHNLPTINGIMQHNGADYKATDIDYKADKNNVVFNLDLAKAYPSEAGIKSWKRTLTLNRNESVVIRDKYSLDKITGDIIFTLMSWAKPIIMENGTIKLDLNSKTQGTARDVFIFYNVTKLNIKTEPILIEDGRLLRAWGRDIYRIILTVKQPLIKDNMVITVKQ
ncbi:heparinase II/III family protein [candidate division KSB1 bacterium]|nr:heparinase II/III family protein [candidate division KSB1 bacterium]